MNIAIIGSGYVGLTTGTCFAELGNNVICADIDKEKVENLRKAIMPIYEPGLKELLERNIREKRLEFTTDIKKAVSSAEVIFICVGTPPKESGEADLSYVENVADEIAKTISSYKVIVEKSTVPVETGEKVMETIRANNRNKVEFDVVSNPEFLREGSAVSDFMNPDRIVIGANSKKAREMMEKLYKPLNAPILFTDIKSAELIKHASNSFLAAKISFINAVANICELTGADVEKVAEGMGLDKRIGKQFLNAGIGYGGSCFPKDVDAFVKLAEKKGYNFELLKAVQKINKLQRNLFIKKIEDALWNIKNKTIGILGLAFKPNTDDMREAPSLDIISALQREGAKIKAYDPEAAEKSSKIFGNIEYCNDPYEAAKDSDALVILTEWSEFKELDLKKVKSLMRNSLVIDGRNIYNKSEMEKLGFKYISVGR
ncbi:UDP-glucose/GDP-mannose dehydrogenase family protein [Candidatus Woesearchaeota archaeon]|nr:UDP-glucose/GDP-mannose dehydrogenase family protein [Candidatus Woesearchaeota archaeon]